MLQREAQQRWRSVSWSRLAGARSEGARWDVKNKFVRQSWCVLRSTRFRSTPSYQSSLQPRAVLKISIDARYKETYHHIIITGARPWLLSIVEHKDEALSFYNLYLRDYLCPGRRRLFYRGKNEETRQQWCCQEDAPYSRVGCRHKWRYVHDIIVLIHKPFTAIHVN